MTRGNLTEWSEWTFFWQKLQNDQNNFSHNGRKGRKGFLATDETQILKPSFAEKLPPNFQPRMDSYKHGLMQVMCGTLQKWYRSSMWICMYYQPLSGLSVGGYRRQQPRTSVAGRIFFMHGPGVRCRKLVCRVLSLHRNGKCGRCDIQSAISLAKWWVLWREGAKMAATKSCRIRRISLQWRRLIMIFHR